MQRFGGSAVVLLLVLVLAAPVAGAQAPAFSPPGSPQQSFSPSVTTLTVDLQADGDATWTVEYRIHLADQNDTEAFKGLQSDIRENRSAYTEQFASRMATTVQSAEDSTNRSMALRNVTVETRLESVTRYGVVTYRFEWSNFAAVDGEEIRAGDAVAGLYLDPSTTLRFAYPDGYAPTQVQPPPTESREGIVVWEGERSFTDSEPLAVFAPGTTDGNGGGATSPGGTTAPGGGTSGGVPGGGGGFPLAAVAAVLVLAGAAAVVWYARDRSGGREPAGPTGEGSDPSASAGGAEPDPAADAEPEPAGPDSAAEAEAETEGADVPPELLSNEERVLRLLGARGGRIKQQEVVGALDWTEAKTSQVLNEMHENGQIEKFRLGRENVIKLPEGDEE